MTKPNNKQPFYTKLSPDVRAAMQRYKAALGVPEAAQVDRALRQWLAARPEAWPVPEPAKRTTRKRTSTTKGGKS